MCSSFKMIGLSVLLAICLVPGALSEPSSRIVGGQATTIDQYPYQVALERGGKLTCGGSILSPVWIVTAAHCVARFSIRDLSVRSGTSRLEQGGVLSPVEKTVVHEDYNHTLSNNDIALLKLKTPLMFDGNTMPIKLASEYEYLTAGLMVTITGWGVLRYNSRVTANQLQKVEVPLISHQQCARDYQGTSRIISKQMICAGATNYDACQGDSGGPLMYKGKLIGIVSWGIGCGSPQYPGVYTRVSDMRSWIAKQTGL